MNQSPIMVKYNDSEKYNLKFFKKFKNKCDLSHYSFVLLNGGINLEARASI